MTRKTAFARALEKLAPFTAAVLLLTSGAAYAQLGAPSGGVTSLSPGMPSASSPVGGTGIPFGSTELGISGLSPPPFATTSGLGTVTTLPGVAGSSSSLGNGLSPGMTPSGSAAPPPLTPTPGITNPRITNYGAGGMQTPPGTPPRRR